MTYSISDLEQLSGVQADTIRIWERRYKALEPMRSAGNTRRYNDGHLRRLLNIVGLSQSGMKISQVCALSDEEIAELLKKEVDHTISTNAQYEYYIVQLIKYGMAYNEPKFDQLISKCIKDNGMTDTYKGVLYPLLVRLGLMWRRDHICPAQEHFLSNIIRQKLYVAINNAAAKTKNTATWLLFLPEDEDHDIGLLFAHYFLKISGQKVIFLGPKVPMDSVKDAMSHHQAEHLLLFMLRAKPIEEASKYLGELSSSFESSKIHISGNYKLMSQLTLATNVNWLQSLQDFEHIINHIADVN